MKIKEAFLLLSRGKQIAAVVCMVHMLTVVGLLGHHLISRRLKPPRPMVVRTISPVKAERSIQTAKREEAPVKQVAAAAKLKSVPAQKTVAAAPKAAPTPAKKAGTTKPMAVAKKGPPVEKEESLFKEIAESFQALSSESKKPSRPALNLPAKMHSKAQLAPQESNDDPTYGEFLIAFLQNTLDLPEHGEVRAKIEIDRFGKLIDCEILEAKSGKNAQFLKNELPLLNFPYLTDFGILDSTKTFSITFRNADT